MSNEDKKNEKNKREDTQEQEKIPIKVETEISHYSIEHGFVEMWYNELLNQTGYLTYHLDDEVKRKDYVWLNKKTKIVPLHPDHGLLKNKFLLFPSDAVDYGTNKELFKEVKSFIRQYVQVSEDFITISALYVLMSWIYDRFSVLPYLRVVGGFGCGKTRFLETIGCLTYKAMFAAGSASTASIFRTIDKIKGTLIFDEADFRNTESWSEIIKMLNSGHTNRFPVIRMKGSDSGNNFETQAFSVFGPKILGSRSRFTDEALESRCLSYVMTPIKNIDKPIHLPEDFDKKARDLRNKLLKFRFDNFLAVDMKSLDLSTLGIPRIKQTLLSLVYTANLINDEVVNSVIQFAEMFETDFINEQSTKEEADVLTSIAYIMSNKDDMAREGCKIRINQISVDYDQSYRHEFDDRINKEVGADGYGAIELSSYKVSARKIGHIVRNKLNIRTRRDRLGFYIPPEEHSKIKILVERYGVGEELEDRFARDKQEGESQPL